MLLHFTMSTQSSQLHCEEMRVWNCIEQWQRKTNCMLFNATKHKITHYTLSKPQFWTTSSNNNSNYRTPFFTPLSWIGFGECNTMKTRIFQFYSTGQWMIGAFFVQSISSIFNCILWSVHQTVCELIHILWIIFLLITNLLRIYFSLIIINARICFLFSSSPVHFSL